MFFFYLVMAYALVLFLVKTRVYDEFYGGQLPPKRVNYWKPFLSFILVNNVAEYFGLYPEWTHGYTFIGSGLLLLSFMFLNRHIFSAWIIATGALLNIIAVASNGGYMPWSPTVGWALVPEVMEGMPVGEHGVFIAEPNLDLLVDRFLFFFPSGRRWAWSIGDAFLASGLFYLLGVEMEDMIL